MITWEDFNFQNKHNKKTAFESMTRILFNYYFFDNNAILKQKHNNPGIEVEPIEYNGKNISFQSKYIESGSPYSQIKESLEIAVSNYSGKLDVIYIFCNKDLDPSSDAYKRLLQIVEPHSITIERFCNESILSTIETKNYKTIKSLFFTHHDVNNEWLDSLLKTSLEDLEPRYMSGFNIDVDIQKYFDVKYLSKEFYDSIKKHLNEIIKDIKSVNFNGSEVNKIYKKIQSLSIPTAEKIYEIFDWHLDFKSDNEYFSKLLDEKIIEIDKCENSNKKQELYSEQFKLERIINYIERINFNNNELFSSLKSNCLLIEGDAGIGKSHLLGFEAEKYGNNYNRTILLLGQKLISNNSPAEQIKEQLGISYDLDTFFYILEGLGEIDNSSTVILIDALNECSNYNVWKNYLNSFISKLSKYKHIKFIGTVRSTYKDIIFSESIKTKISNKEILLIKHKGFEGILDEAITKFFNFYNIPITTASYIAYEYNNPLLLKIFCSSYDKNDDLGFKSIYSLFEHYINDEERKVKNIINDISSYSYFKAILKIVGKYLYENKQMSIALDKLYELCNIIPSYEKYLPYLLKSKILVSYYLSNEEYIYFGYERMADFIIAENIVKNASSYNEIVENIKTNLFELNEYGYFIHSNASGIFSALSIIVSEMFNKEIIGLVNDLNIKAFEKYQIIEDYISNLVYRKNETINKKELLEFLSSNSLPISVRDAFFNTLLMLSGRAKNSLNAYMLHEYLSSKPLNIRDANWTIFINDNFYERSNLFHIINYFENNHFSGTAEEKELFSITITWLLTSSNRSLRDRASRCLRKLLENEVPLIQKLLTLFKDINDPYVLQRLYGVSYGVILLSKELKENEIIALCQIIYDNIFAKDIVYEDILLRDYALNIIEYAKYLNYNIAFDINKCRPPYRSNPIKVVNDNIEEYYSYSKEKPRITGAYLIQSSIIPNINGGYGDFGRYVFESALDDFENVDIKKLYYNALDIIRNELGYDNELFSEYDTKVHRYQAYDRHNTNKVERIGKKYQWIAFYKILAKISDCHKLNIKYSDRSSAEYKGSWNPYVRDFDPSLNLINRDKVYNLPISLSQPVYSNWDIGNNEWANISEDVLDYDKYVEVKDNNDESWIILHASFKQMSSTDYDNDYREVWRMLNCYFIRNSEFPLFFKYIKNAPLWERWFSESRERYNLFGHEYCWSPAYEDEYGEEILDVEVKTNKTKQIKNSNNYPNIYINGEKVSINESDEKFTTIPVYKQFTNIMPSWNEYMWEEQYDASKEDVVSYSLPCAQICRFLNLKQQENGLFYLNNELVAIDFSLVNGTTEGLYIKKNLFDSFIKENGLTPFWICVGEKNDVKKESRYKTSNNSIYRDVSSFIYYSREELQCINFYGDRRND